MNVTSIKEHDSLAEVGFSTNELLKEYLDGYCLNKGESRKGRKFFFNLEDRETGREFYASYIIGAQNISVGDEKKPLVVRPKIDGLDFLRMFDLCFRHRLEPNAFKKIYSIDFQQKPIETNEFQSVLSPLIVVHFLSLIDGIVRKGLKKDFINREDNLKKIRGRIDFIRNERKNVMQQRFDRIYCRYQEFSVNTPENRLLKRALLFSQRLLQNSMIADGMKYLQTKVSQYLTAFASVDDNIEVWQINQIRRNKLYREYAEALQVAQTLLRRYDYNLSNVSVTENFTPAFWIDMSLLYEMYVYALLKDKHLDIDYQKHFGKDVPDFLHPEEKMIIDTKYKPDYEKNEEAYDIRQLSGYARNIAIRKKINVDEYEILPCLILYPSRNGIRKFTNDKILEEKGCKTVDSYLRFYKLGIHLPIVEGDFNVNVE